MRDIFEIQNLHHVAPIPLKGSRNHLSASTILSTLATTQPCLDNLKICRASLRLRKTYLLLTIHIKAT